MNATTNHQQERQKQLMLGKRATGQQLVMVSKRGWRPGSKSVDDCTMVGADKFGRRTMQQARGNRRHNTNHQQEYQRCSDVSRGCSNSDGKGKGAATTFVNRGVVDGGNGGMEPMAPMTALLTAVAVDGGGNNDLVAAAINNNN